MAVKTGTSTDFRDNWTLSYHPDAVIGVWVGNLDSSPMTEVSGITGAGRLWHDIAEYMIKMGFIKNTPNTIPDGVHASYLCLDSGCFQRQKTYKKNDKESRSHILEKAYFRSDFFTLPNEEEMKRWNIQY